MHRVEDAFCVLELLEATHGLESRFESSDVVLCHVVRGGDAIIMEMPEGTLCTSQEPPDSLKLNRVQAEEVL